MIIIRSLIRAVKNFLPEIKKSLKKLLSQCMITRRNRAGTQQNIWRPIHRNITCRHENVAQPENIIQASSQDTQTRSHAVARAKISGAD